MHNKALASVLGLNKLWRASGAGYCEPVGALGPVSCVTGFNS